MPLELTAALVAFLAVAAWRLARRQRTSESAPLPDVEDAPPSSDPIAVWRYDPNGFERYPQYLRRAGDAEENPPPD
jgi:hypothetical protein